MLMFKFVLMVRDCLAPDLPEFLTSQLLHPLPGAPFRARLHDYLGVDFGRSGDPSDLAIVEFAPTPTYRIDPITRAHLFDCSLYLRHLASPPLGPPFTAIVDRQAPRHPLRSFPTPVALANPLSKCSTSPR